MVWKPKKSPSLLTRLSLKNLFGRKSDQEPASKSLAKFQKTIGYRFKKAELLKQSLTHPSWAQEQANKNFHNQRLEFLGDAILSAVLAEKLYELLPNEREGVLTRNRSILAKGAHLSRLARELGLDLHIIMNKAEEAGGGRRRASTLEDALEALVGAIYLDSDWETARRVVLGWYGDLRGKLQRQVPGHNPKGALQELMQPRLGNEAIEYVLVEVSGPDHQKHFKVRVLVAGEVMGTGEGPSKREAEEAAARQALENVELKIKN